jgi:hypothetical protein
VERIDRGRSNLGELTRQGAESVPPLAASGMTAEDVPAVVEQAVTAGFCSSLNKTS